MRECIILQSRHQLEDIRAVVTGDRHYFPLQVKAPHDPDERLHQRLVRVLFLQSLEPQSDILLFPVVANPMTGNRKK